MSDKIPLREKRLECAFQIREAGGVAGEELSVGQDALHPARGHAGAETSTKGKSPLHFYALANCFDIAI